MLHIDDFSVPGKAFAHSFIIPLLQVIFSESSGSLEMLEAPGKQLFFKGEILHLLATWIALFDSNIEGHLVKSCEQHLQLFFLYYRKKCAWQILSGLWMLLCSCFLFPFEKEKSSV